MLTNLADVLRSAGLPVTETPGWKTRGHGEMLGVRGVLWHHTATAASAAGDYPSLRIVTDGRSDLAGPLCNLGLGRSGMWYAVSAGVAWHAGPGSWPGVGTDGNDYLIGIEAEHPGLANVPWPFVQLDSYRKGTAALLNAFKLGSDRMLGHKEWAPTRKIDPISLNMTNERSIVNGLMHQAPPIKRNENEVTALPYPFPGCPRGSDGKLIEQEHTFVCPVGASSSVTDRAWLSFKCANGPAEHVRMMAISTLGQGVTNAYVKTQDWTNLANDTQRAMIECGGTDHVDQFTVFVKCATPYSICIETRAKNV